MERKIKKVLKNLGGFTSFCWLHRKLIDQKLYFTEGELISELIELRRNGKIGICFVNDDLAVWIPDR